MPLNSHIPIVGNSRSLGGSGGTPPPLLNTEGLQYLVGNDGRNALDQLGFVVPTVENCDVAKVKFDGVGDHGLLKTTIPGGVDFVEITFYNYTEITKTSPKQSILTDYNHLDHGLIAGSVSVYMTDETLSFTTGGAAGGNRGFSYIRDTVSVGWHTVTITGDSGAYKIALDGVDRSTYYSQSPEQAADVRWLVAARKHALGFSDYFKCVFGCLNCDCGAKIYGEEAAGNTMFDVSGNGNDIELISTEGTDAGIERMRSAIVDGVLCYTAKNGYSKDGDMFVPAHSEKVRPYPVYDGVGSWSDAGGQNYVFLQEYKAGFPPIIPPTPNGRINFNGYYKQEVTYISDLSAKFGITSMYGADSSDGVCIELFEDKVRYFPDQALTSYVDIPCSPPKNVFTEFALEHDGNEVSVSFKGTVANTVTTALTLTQEEMQVLVIGAGREQGTNIPFKGGLYDYKISIEKGVLWVDFPLDKELLYPFDRAGSHTYGGLRPIQKTMYGGIPDSRYPLTDTQGNPVKYAGGMLHNGAPFGIKQSDTSDLSLLPSDNIWLEADGTTRKKLSIDELRALVNMDKDFALQLKRIADDTDPVFPKAIQYKGGTINLMNPAQMNQLKRWTKVIV